jgi:hypothetical protein
MRRFAFVLPWNYTIFESFELEDLEKKILSENLRKDELMFTIFDFSKGTITTKVYEKDGKALTPTIEERHKPFNGKESKKKRDQKFAQLSKRDVYNFIVQIGKTNPGEFYGVSFSADQIDQTTFAIDEGGPYESSLDPDLNYLKQDDFGIRKMGFENLTYFKKAFNPNAINIVFALIPIHNPYHDLIDLVSDSRKPLEDAMTLDLSKIGLPFRKGDFSSFMKKNFQQNDIKKIPFSAVKSLFCYAIKSQYAFALAAASERITYSNVPGSTVTNIYFNNYRFKSSEKNKVEELEQTIHNERTIRFYQKYMDFEDVYEGFLLLPYDPKYTCNFPIEKPIDLELIKPPKISRELHDHYIFICGIDYKITGLTFDFTKACDTKMNDIFAIPSTAPRLVFHIFDFLKGEKRTKIATQQKDLTYVVTEEEPGELDTFAPVKISRDYKILSNDFGENENYFVNEKFFREKSEKYLLTISRVYELILLHINAPNPATLPLPGEIKEICFFSHGNEKGPILFNADYKRFLSMEDAPPEKRKEPFERWLDPEAADMNLPLFDLQNSDDKNTLALRNALAENVIITMYGCNSNVAFLKLIKSIVESDEYKKGGLEADTLITLKNPGRILKHFLKDHTGLEKDSESTPLKWKYRLGDLLLFFKDVLCSSYMMNFSITADRPTYGGLPGLNTYIAETDDGGLISVDPEFKKYFKFYTRHFGFESDKDLPKPQRSFDNVLPVFDLDRQGGYAKYVPDFPWVIKEGVEGIKF